MRHLSQRAQMEAPQRGPDPGDQVLIDTEISLGKPREEAGVWRDHLRQGTYGRRILRYCALATYWDVRAAARGDAAARDRIDFLRSAYDALNKANAERLREEGVNLAGERVV